MFLISFSFPITQNTALACPSLNTVRVLRSEQMLPQLPEKSKTKRESVKSKMEEILNDEDKRLFVCVGIH